MSHYKKMLRYNVVIEIAGDVPSADRLPGREAGQLIQRVHAAFVGEVRRTVLNRCRESARAGETGTVWPDAEERPVMAGVDLDCV